MAPQRNKVLGLVRNLYVAVFGSNDPSLLNTLAPVAHGLLLLAVVAAFASDIQRNSAAASRLSAFPHLKFSGRGLSEKAGKQQSKLG